MTITATFTANFSSFNDAVAKADAKLKDFGEGADKVGKKLERMANEFSGRKVVQDAAVMVRAIEEIGGASRLTAQELQRAGAKAEEAIAKMKVLGMEIPPGLQKIATAAQDAQAKLQALGEKAPDLKKVTTETSALNSKQTELIGTLRNVAGAFGIAFSVQAVVGWVRGVVEAAGAIDDMAGKLGISTDAAQRFSFAAQQSGASMGDVESAIVTLNKSLAGGGNSTVGALSALGLAFEDIRQMAPEEAFVAIAEGLRQIPDPMLQTQLAMELFGRSGAQLLPAIKDGFVEIGKAAPVAADWAIKAIDDWSKQWDDLVANTKTKSIEMVAAIREPAIAHEEAVKAMAKASGEQRPDIVGAEELDRLKKVPPALRAVTVSVEDERAAIKQLDAALKEQNAAAEKAANAQRVWNEQLRAFRNFLGLRQMEDARAAMDAQAKQIEANVELEFELGKMYQQNAAALGGYAGNVGLYTEQWSGYMQLAPGITKNLTNNGKALIEANRGISDSLKSLMSGDFQTVFKDIGDFFKGGMQSIGTGFLESIGSGMLNMVTDMAMKGLSALGTKIGKLFGFDKEKKRTDEMRQAFIDLSGGWDALNKSADRAGLTLARVLNAKTVKEYEAALKELQTAIAFQESAMATLDETAKRYGFTLEELGPALQRQELDKQAQQLFKDWEVLNAAGIDTVAITSRMSESINAYLQQAMALGTEVPAAMKPMLEEMVRMGQLTDASGNRIDSLEDAGISFAMTMSEGFKALIDEVGKLTQAIARGLGVALDTTTDKIVKMPKTIGVDVVYNDPGFHGEIQVPAGDQVPSFATGSGGKYLNFGSGTLAMLHGREKITPAGASEGGDVSELRAEVQGLRADLARQSRLLPKQLRDALLLAS
jgi:tetratricopeptide (TPR) repeat protein